MARYKETEKGQGLFLTVNLAEQLVPGTYEYMLNRLIDKKLDLSIFDRKYKNDLTGASAIEPKVLLKIILYCYSLGVISSRKIENMCRKSGIYGFYSDGYFRTFGNFTRLFRYEDFAIVYCPNCSHIPHPLTSIYPIRRKKSA